ncbi:MAG TPA: tripartite tricarboxylate transporter substrate binding protein [Burkholderiales bacterium]|nr:tripartite tricarboxylate transporter substrate binding protein [Burkholderiales bacterium]
MESRALEEIVTMIGRSIRCIACASLISAGGAIAQDKPANYPTRPVRLIVSVQPGAGADAMARAAAQMLTDALGQNVVVDNRPGGSGVIAAETVARAAPDGYTLLTHGETLMILSALKKVPELLKTFDPIVSTSTQPYVMLVQPGLPVKSIKELVAYSNTQRLTYSGSAGVGSAVHLGMERFTQLSGAKLLFVPYKGSAPAIIALMGGEIQVALGSAIAASNAMRTGKVRALATLGPARIPSMPDIPTVAEQGFPGFKITNRYNVFTPAGTAKPIINVINRVIGEGMHSPQMAQRLAADGAQPAERMSPAQLRETIAHEYAEIQQQVKQMGSKIQ